MAPAPRRDADVSPNSPPFAPPLRMLTKAGFTVVVAVFADAGVAPFLPIVVPSTPAAHAGGTVAGPLRPLVVEEDEGEEEVVVVRAST